MKRLLMFIFMLTPISCSATPATVHQPVRAAAFLVDPSSPAIKASAFIYDPSMPVLRASAFIPVGDDQ